MNFDKSAVSAGEMSVKLRHTETNSKLPRTPYNLESAVGVLAMEVAGLNGEESLDRMLTAVLWQAADDRTQNGFMGHEGKRIPIAVEYLVNEFGTNRKDGLHNFNPAVPHDNAMRILMELRAMFEDDDLGRDLKDLIAKHQA